MLFLIEYDRSVGKLVGLKQYTEAQREQVAEARLVLELDLSRKGIRNEIVVLEAADEKALRKTHRRYFESLEELARLV